MNSPFLPRIALSLFASLLWTAGADAETQILKWKDGKKAVIILSFDDSAPSQLKNAIPELEKRHLVGTFYLVTGSGVWTNTKAGWTAAAKSPSVIVANHTLTHKGVKSVEELGPELAKCNEVLYALNPERKLPRLLAFGRPGGVPWEITEEQQAAELAKNNLINRPSFFGPPIHLHSADECLALVDKALAKGDMAHFDMHGVGGDWLVTPMDWFIPLLDKMDANREAIWNTDTLTWHKYVQERDGASVKELESTPQRVRVELTSKTDAAMYDEPLTLSTTVPASWQHCLVVQGAQKATVAAANGAVRYAALPNGGEITITSVSK